MGGERSAAHLRFRDDDFDAICVEDADGGVVETREGDLRDAAGEEGDASALLPYRGISAAELLEEKWSFNRGKELLAIGNAEEFEHAAEADEFLQAAALVDPDEAREGCDAFGRWQKFAEGEVARDAGEERALIIALDERAGVLDEFAVLDGGWAGGFAGAAVEAFVDVLDERFCDLRLGRGGFFGAVGYGAPGGSLSV